MSAWGEANAAWLARARARWAPERVEPLRLRVWLASPIAWDGYHPVMIEGPLQFVVVGLESGRSPDDAFARCPLDEDVDVPIPIADERIGDRLVARASIGWPIASALQDKRFRRRRARIDAMGGGGRLVIAGGWSKALNIPLPTLITPFLDFFVEGDRAKLGELVRHLTGLGRDATRGLASVIGTEIDDDPDRRSMFLHGAPQRALPRGALADRSASPGTWTERRCGVRAPYWHPRNQAECVVPARFE